MYKKDFREGGKTEKLNYFFCIKNIQIEVKVQWKLEKNLYIPFQKHTNRIILLKYFPALPIIGDGVVTALKDVKIGVKTADCTPLVVLGKERVGIAHIGWRGLATGIVERLLRELGEDPSNIFAFLGPAAKSCCYRVGEEFKNLFPDYVRQRDGKLFMDMQESVIKELESFGVRDIGFMEICTVCSETFPSYRRNKTSERFLTTVRIP